MSVGLCVGVLYVRVALFLSGLLSSTGCFVGLCVGLCVSVGVSLSVWGIVIHSVD